MITLGTVMINDDVMENNCRAEVDTGVSSEGERVNFASRKFTRRNKDRKLLCHLHFKRGFYWHERDNG